MAGSKRYARGLSEVALAVADVERSVTFYTEVVALELERRGEAFAFLWAGEPGRRQRVILLSRDLPALEDRPRSRSTPEPPPALAALRPGLLGPTHFALEVSADEIEAAVAHVGAKGVEVWGPVDFGWFGSGHYFLDPDGHWVEFWTPSPRDEEEG